jgi:hypothetical protein
MRNPEYSIMRVRVLKEKEEEKKKKKKKKERNVGMWGKNKKLWEELVAYFPLIRHGPHRK